MPMPNAYLAHLVAGDDPGDVDDWIERWHREPGGLDLHEFLGLTREEHGHWLHAPEVMGHLAAVHRLGGTARDALLAAVRRDATGPD